jgi:hypothetical protein
MAIAAQPGTAGFGVMNGTEMSERGRAFWGRGVVEDGEPINIIKAQEAAQIRALNVLETNPRADFILPLIEMVDPQWVRKAVFDESYGLDGLRGDIQKAKEDWMSNWREEIKKATTSSVNMSHIVTDAEVVQLFKRIHPVQSLIGVEACLGKVAQWDAIPPNGAGTAYFGPEDPQNLTESDITDVTQNATCKILYSVMRVTKMAQMSLSAQSPARDIVQIRTNAAQEMIKNLRERSLLGVSRDVQSTTNPFTAADTLEYKGLYELITANTGTPNWLDASGSTIDTMDKIQPYLDNTYLNMIQDGMNPNLILSDYKTFNLYRRGLNDFFRSENMEKTTFGVAIINLVFPGGTIPMIPVPFLPTTTGTNGSAFMLDTEYIALRKLWGDTYEELANWNTSKRGVITAAEVLIDKTDTTGTASLQGGVFGITI